MKRWKSLPQRVRRIMLGAGLFLCGAGLSFAYSYRPLHGALIWKVDSLEMRLDERNRENTGLKGEITKLRRHEETRVEPETLAQIEAELARTKKALRAAERKIKSADRKRRNANANADRWRKRYESLGEPQPASPGARGVSPAAPGNDLLDSRSEVGATPRRKVDSATLPEAKFRLPLDASIPSLGVTGRSESDVSPSP